MNNNGNKKRCRTNAERRVGRTFFVAMALGFTLGNMVTRLKNY